MNGALNHALNARVVQAKGFPLSVTRGWSAASSRGWPACARRCSRRVIVVTAAAAAAAFAPHRAPVRRSLLLEQQSRVLLDSLAIHDWLGWVLRVVVLLLVVERVGG